MNAKSLKDCSWKLFEDIASDIKRNKAPKVVLGYSSDYLNAVIEGSARVAYEDMENKGAVFGFTPVNGENMVSMKWIQTNYEDVKAKGDAFGFMMVSKLASFTRKNDYGEVFVKLNIENEKRKIISEFKLVKNRPVISRPERQNCVTKTQKGICQYMYDAGMGTGNKEVDIVIGKLLWFDICSDEVVTWNSGAGPKAVINIVGATVYGHTTPTMKYFAEWDDIKEPFKGMSDDERSNESLHLYHFLE